MLTFEQFAGSLADAYEHLYDIVYLRTHPVTAIAAAQPDVQHNQREPAWRAHHALIEAIQQLNPEGRAPTLSKTWRKHRLMLLRYIEGLSPQEVADALSISRRQFYRVQDEALQALAEMLWPNAGLPTNPENKADRSELLRAEVERHKRDGKPISLTRVTESALALLHARLAQHRVTPRLIWAESLPALDVDEKLFRQLLLSVMDHLVERAHNATLEIAAQADASTVQIRLCVNPPVQLSASAWAHTREQVQAFKELAALNQVQLDWVREGETLYGFALQRAVGNATANAQRVVLAVDDNADILELYRRYLAPCGFQVLTARHGQDAFNQIRHVQPHAIFLDLMLPEQDGWDILQTLKSHPDTRTIPVIICSVLKQSELALSLGAMQFVEKPFTQAGLLTALTTLKGV
jgi:CheY-like chemotaxis protein